MKRLAVWLWLCSISFAQLDVTLTPYYQLSGLGKVVEINGLTLTDKIPSITSKQVGILTITTTASNIEVVVSDSNRVPYDAKKISNDKWLIDKAGKWWVDITAIDFPKQIYGRKSLVIEVGGNPDPGPGPSPDPGPGPTPTPGPISNEYGLGGTAYNAAPIGDSSGAKQAAKIYGDAANFLYGIPSLKFVTSANDSHNNDPERSVMAWINAQYAVLPSTWTDWKKQVHAALIESQKKRSYTRQDWYNAFTEISKGVAERGK